MNCYRRSFTPGHLLALLLTAAVVAGALFAIVNATR